MEQSLLYKISTKPSQKAVKWARREYSILSNIILWTLWFCRLLSLLQILKFIYRKIAIILHKDDVDENSFRPNVSPLFCEIYFIIWFVILLLIYLCKIRTLFLSVLLIYYLFETIVWTLYYTIFRRFFEENYSIYHELEYLSELMLIIPSQALAFAYLFKDTFSRCLLGILGLGVDQMPLSIQMLGALFSIIIISMIISAFPSEKIKKSIGEDR